jgi:UDP-glucose 4-epimerase
VHILVTGGAGFIGSHVVEALLAREDEVTVADDLSTGERRNLPGSAHFVKVDIADGGALFQALGALRFDTVVHAAAEASVVRSISDPAHSERVNVHGTQNVLALARHTGAKRFVFFSSGGAIYGDMDVSAREDDPLRPISPYGRHKIEGEKLVSAFGLSYAVLRPANVYGPRQRGDIEGGVVAIFLQRWRESRELVVFGDGRAVRDYVYVQDVARAVLRAVDARESGTWNIGTGVPTSVNGVIDALGRHLGEPPAGVRHAPPRAGELQRACLNPSLAIQDLGWRPQVTFDAGIALCVAQEHVGQRSDPPV